MGKKKRSVNTSEWLNTYADMVTLLLCFFVLLYSISNVDKEKYEKIAESFNPSAVESTQTGENTAAGGGSATGGVTVDGTDDFDDLYYRLSKYVETEGLGADVEISKGDGFTFITFRNNIFFDGDSYVLKQEGKDVLDQLSNAITDVSASIAEIEILGHTSQASPTEPNEVESDRFLSSNRASVVLVYLQNKNIIDPSRLVSCGFGQFRPISPFDTKESRAKNRRVEIIITKNDGVTKSLDDYYKEVYDIDTAKS